MKKVLVDQDLSDVGHTVWDAEVILAHFMESRVDIDHTSSVLELGAGCAIAAIVASRRGAAYVAVQELADVLPHTEHCLRMNGCHGVIDSFAALWGPECIQAIVQLRGANADTAVAAAAKKSDCRPPAIFDFIIMADVLYHANDFQLLISTIESCLSARGTLIISYEQRRRDLAPFFDQLHQHFQLKQLYNHTVRQCIVHESENQRETAFVLRVYERCKP
jgi:predicted nicotinamide N-methyase